MADRGPLITQWVCSAGSACFQDPSRHSLCPQQSPRGSIRGQQGLKTGQGSMTATAKRKIRGEQDSKRVAQKEVLTGETTVNAKDFSSLTLFLAASCNPFSSQQVQA